MKSQTTMQAGQKAGGKSIGVAIITHNSVRHLPYCLPPLLTSPLLPKILVVNSSSSDGTAYLAEELGAETLIIPRSSFNHGDTRELARKTLATDIVVMMTPDAYLCGGEMLEKLIAPIVDGTAAVAYARQLPHDGAAFFETFGRHFNYPSTSELRSSADIEKQGAHAFFCSNSCAAWSSAALDEAGGFPTVLFGEDSLATAAILAKGHRIAYVAEATVKHSHSYSLRQEFRRCFDIGYARKQNSDLLQLKNSDTKRGSSYVKTMCCELAKKRPYLLPYAIVQSAIKYAGYAIGSRSEKAPLWLKKLFSSQDFYWK